jgi:hypothetical protein
MWHLIHHRRDQKPPRPPRGKDSALGMAERQRMERERLAERLKSYRRGKETGRGYRRAGRALHAEDAEEIAPTASP